MILTMVEIQPKSAGGSEGLSSDDFVYSLAAEIREKILSHIDPDSAHPSLIQVTSRTTMLSQ
jgi:hypothetical protein